MKCFDYEATLLARFGEFDAGLRKWSHLPDSSIWQRSELSRGNQQDAKRECFRESWFPYLYFACTEMAFGY
jgi:hypothetical protein